MYYAVLKGRGKTPAIYDNWEECKEKVTGYPNAQFKKFRTKKEAQSYIDEHLKDKDSNNQQETSLIAYVDGSYHAGEYSYGLVILKNGKIIKKMNGKGRKGASMHQVYGELKGAMKAIEYAVKEKEPAIEIRYDYAGIEMWANGLWKRNNEHTQYYHDFIQKKRQKIKIMFRKIKAHSGDYYNDLADELAKKAFIPKE
ncbi:MAG: viroplasmin family protein [Candidatus Woesearchaeota archaeon]